MILPNVLVVLSEKFAANAISLPREKAKEDRIMLQ